MSAQPTLIVSMVSSHGKHSKAAQKLANACANIVKFHRCPFIESIELDRMICQKSHNYQGKLTGDT
jgi:hypothetical protein